MPRWKDHILPEPEERIRELTAKEEEALVEALGEMREDYLPMIDFAILSGLRLGNVIRLTWSDVDYEAMVLRVRGKSRKPGGKTIILPLTTAMTVLIAERREEHPIYVFTYVCKRSRGERRKGKRYPYSQNGWRKDWAKVLAAAGIEDFRFHDLRHTFGTRVLRQTGNMKLVQKALAHEDIATTAKYGHVLLEDLRAGMEETFRHHDRHHREAEGTNKLEDKGKSG